MIEFIKDFIDELPNLSHIQLGLILAVIFLIYFVEYLIFYNSMIFGAMSLPIGGPPSNGTIIPPANKRQKKRP